MGCINLFLNLFFLLEEKNSERIKCKGKKKDLVSQIMIFLSIFRIIGSTIEFFIFKIHGQIVENKYN